MRGETFGLSCLEFAMLGKPVLTYAGSPEQAHLEILGDMAVAYHNAQGLRKVLEDLGQGSEFAGQRPESHRPPPFPGKHTNEKFKEYQPEAVMQKFEQVFLR